MAGSVLLRRFLARIGLGAAALILLWAVALAVTRPPDHGPPRPRRFDFTIGKARAPEPSPIDYSRLDARLRRLMEEPEMVGLAVAIVDNGEIRFAKGYGVTEAGGSDPVTTSTLFRWASLSKGVAADMVTLLASQRRLSLSDPVSRYAASLHLPDGNEYRATVGDLLSHRLGLFGHAQDARLEGGQDPHLLRAQLALLHNICPPGTCHAYQNVAYDAASEIVERVTGEPYSRVVRERLFLPLGMRSASYGREALMSARSWARPHVGGHAPRAVEISDAYYRIPAAGGVNGSIEDLAIWMEAQMGEDSDVLPPRVLAAVQTPLVRTPRENRRRREFRERTPISAYGLGWRVFNYAGHKVVGHHGGVQGYRSLMMFDPARRTGVVALWNSSTGQPGGLEYEVMDMVYRLPFRDWLEIDERSRDAQPGAAPGPENDGGSG